MRHGAKVCSASETIMLNVHVVLNLFQARCRLYKYFGYLLKSNKIEIILKDISLCFNSKCGQRQDFTTIFCRC